MTRLEIGRVARPHGLRGEVVVHLVTDRHERLAPGAILWAGEQRLEVGASQRHGARWLVRFDGISDRDAAEALAGTALTGEPIVDPDALWVHELIGTRVVEADGTDRGLVIAVIDNPAHDLLELESGALVPMVFVVTCADGVTTIAPPLGLFD